MPVLEMNPGQGNTLPGPVRSITVQSGQIVVIDPTTKPATTTTLSADETYDAEGKAGLGISDIDGSRIYYESSNEADNRTSSQLVTAPDQRPEQLTDIHGEPKDAPVPTTVVPNAGDADDDDTGSGSYEDRTVAQLKATAKKNGVELHGASTKKDIIEKIRG